nr:immunoglobulin light chain junction region [Macaca mulatta]MOW29337.1 immunoglobulin light chain junction region [Macaca mulatta]MOW29667.1 immunoglobulin light chain junction region [Macaca mulatta]MOW30307.1 immunoglobulin light chain junction region [Macaca mulatta]MOW30337.1 immunoglobulin light chain junction region [Macaca mulatta]
DYYCSSYTDSITWVF